MFPNIEKSPELTRNTTIMADLGSKVTASWPIKLAPGARPGQKKNRNLSETEEPKVHVNYEIRRKGRGCKKVWRVGGNDCVTKTGLGGEEV